MIEKYDYQRFSRLAEKKKARIRSGYEPCKNCNP